MEMNSAEIYAIFRATKISLSCARINKANVIVESDSSNDVRWCNADSGGLWNMNFILNLIRDIRKSFPNVIIVHKSRKTNMVMDALTKQGLRRDVEFLAWCKVTLVLFVESSCFQLTY